ncbi:MAG: hypothetical protein IH582_08795 [Afipia sp.]|nr:hypothetical protein [Afipia sp.]
MRVQDTEMNGSSDDELLVWLADEGRILLTHDVRTMPRFVHERVRAGQAVPGMIEVHKDTPIGVAIDELEVTIGAGTPEDFANQVKYIPCILGKGVGSRL